MLVLKPRGGALNTSVVHICGQRNIKKGVFWDWMQFARIAMIKTCLFSSKRVLFKFYYRAFRSHFSYFSILHIFKKSCLGVKMGETLQNSCLGVVFLKRVNLYKAMFWKPRVTHVYNNIWVRGGTHIGKGYGDVPQSWPPFFRPVTTP